MKDKTFLTLFILKNGQDEIISLKKTSSKIARDVRKFWLKINKVIAFRQKGEADDVRQKVIKDTIGHSWDEFHLHSIS